MTQVQEDQQSKSGGMKEWLRLTGKILEAIITAVMFFFEPLMELIVLGTYAVYDLLYFGFPAWLPERYKAPILSISNTVSAGVIMYSLLLAGGCLLITLSRMGWRSSRIPFFSPAVFTWLVCIGLAYAATSNLGLISIIAQWLLLAWFCVPIILSKRRPSSVIRGTIESRLPKKYVCSVCHQPSVSDPCPSCKKRYQQEYQRVRSQVLRAKMFGVSATLTLGEWLTTLKAFDYKCAYCQLKPYELMEHYIPLPHGGTTAENCVPGCYSCNNKKSNKHPEK